MQPIHGETVHSQSESNLCSRYTYIFAKRIHLKIVVNIAVDIHKVLLSTERNCYAKPFFYHNINDIVVDWQICWHTHTHSWRSPNSFAEFPYEIEAACFGCVRARRGAPVFVEVRMVCNVHMFRALKTYTAYVVIIGCKKSHIIIISTDSRFIISF